jgi:nucleoside 2-deoxyribosyltransferase
LKKKLYLANPYGFSKQTKSLLNEFINIFNGLNIEVYEPFERTKQIMKKKITGLITWLKVISMI